MRLNQVGPQDRDSRDRWSRRPQEIKFGFTEASELVSIEFLDAAQILPPMLLESESWGE